MANQKALIAMSGGVDSSVSAAIMLDAGYDCMGVTMKLYQNEDIGISREKTCCSADDTEDAASVARKLGIPFYVFNYTEEFKCKVMNQFIESYLNGETPNPCITCNKHMKFDALYERGKILGCEKIVTGHYAQIVFDEESDRWQLRKGADESKDQSYVLYCLTQEQLSHTCFPLGGMAKSEVREIAEARGFINARKHDSQDICFVPDGDYAGFIERSIGHKLPEGDFVEADGKVVGTHKGIIHYTIGQRKGLGIAAKAPYFVQEIRPAENQVVLGDNDGLFRKTLYAKDVVWGSIEQPEGPIRCLGKIRYKHKEQPCTARMLEDGTLEVIFDEPQRAITRGQSVVLYDGDVVLGGGVIFRVGEE